MAIDGSALLKSLSLEAHKLASDAAAGEKLREWRDRVEAALTDIFGTRSPELEAFVRIRYEPEIGWVERTLEHAHQEGRIDTTGMNVDLTRNFAEYRKQRLEEAAELLLALAINDHR